MNGWVKKYIESDEKKKRICEYLKNNPMMSHKVAEHFGFALATAALLLKELMLDGYILRQEITKPTQRRKMVLFSTSNKQFVPRSLDEIEKLVQARMDTFSEISSGKFYENKMQPTHPNGRVIRNLDRPGSDYAWQRKKRRHTAVGIGSSFALYDGLT